MTHVAIRSHFFQGTTLMGRFWQRMSHTSSAPLARLTSEQSILNATIRFFVNPIFRGLTHSESANRTCMATPAMPSIKSVLF